MIQHHVIPNAMARLHITVVMNKARRRNSELFAMTGCVEPFDFGASEYLDGPILGGE